MAKEAAVWEVIKNAGYEPIENKSIIVSYAPANLSDAIVKFLEQTISISYCRSAGMSWSLSPLECFRWD